MPDPARFTDDTQMTLFTAEGLVGAAEAGRTDDPVPFVHAALPRRLATQGGPPVEDDGLLADPRMHEVAAPGSRCLSALEDGRPIACNDSKGCGTIMRVAPRAFAPVGRVRGLARDTSTITHGHPTGQAAAAFWAELLRAARRGAEPEAAARALLPGHGGETAAAVRLALDASRDGRPETTERLGGGWVAEEAPAIALHAALSARGLEDGLRIAATHGGDSDSTAAVAGNLLGLVHPEEAPGHPWRARLVGADLVAGAAAALPGAGRPASRPARAPGAAHDPRRTHGPA